MTGSPLKILLIGCGAMGGALARGWLTSSLEFQLTVVNPDKETVESLPGSQDLAYYPSVDQIPLDYTPDVIVLAVKPGVLSEVLPNLRYYQTKNPLFVSIAAGKGLSFFQDNLWKDVQLIKVMPNLPVAYHQGMCAGYAPSYTQDPFLKITETLFQAVGKFTWLEQEEDFHAITVLSGCGPAYLYLLEETLIKAAEKMGIPEERAAIVARQTLVGAASLLQHESASATDLKVRVTSPGGVTEAARSVLEKDDAILKLFELAFSTALNRSKDIADGS